MALAQAVCTAFTSSSEMEGTKGTWVGDVGLPFHLFFT